MLKKKCMSFFMAMLMVLSTMVFAMGTAAADEISLETVADAVAAVAAEKISAEPLSLITKNLTLPTTAAGAAVSISWASSDESVVAADGTVKRDFLESKTATLTATVTDGTTTQTVTHNLTVAPRTINSYKQETFYYPDYTTIDSNASGAASTWWSGGASGFTSIATDTDGYYVKAAYSTVQTALTARLHYEKNTVVYLYMKIKTDGTATNGIHLRPIVRNGDGDGNKLNSTVAKIQAANVYNGPNSGWQNAGILTTGSFTPVIFKLDLVNNQCSAKVGDRAWSIPTTLSSSYSYVDGDYINQVQLVRGSSSTAEHDLLIAEAAAYSEVELSTIIGEMSDAEKVAMFKNLIAETPVTSESAAAVTQNLDLDCAYAEYDLDTWGISVNWTSSDANTISAAGEVDADDLAAKTVTMTATITAGDVSDTVSIPLVVVQKAGTTIHDTSSGDNKYFMANDFESEGITLAQGPLGAGTFEYAADADAGHGNVLKLTNPGSGSAYWGAIKLYNLKFDGRYFVNFNMKYKRTDTETAPDAFGGVEILGITGNLGGSAYLKFDTREVGMYTSVVNSDGTVENVVLDYDMPDSVQEDEWCTVTYDYNLISRTYQLYLNGELINEIPLLKARVTDTSTAHPLRGFRLATSKNGIVSMDNLSVRWQSDTYAAMANGGLNAALITYAAEEQHGALTARASLQTAGPAASAEFVKTDYANNPGMYSFTGGAALTYALDGAAVTAVNPTAPETKALTITSTYNGKSESKTVQRKLAPISIDGITAGSEITKVVLSGAVNGQKVAVAAYKDNGKTLSAVQIFDAAAAITPNMSMADADTVKVFVFSDMTALQPVTFAKLK